MSLSVSQLAGRAGISSDTVRYYGRLGLLPETGRTKAGHRYYDEAALDRLRFIKGAQWFDLRLEDIRGLLAVLDTESCPCGHTRDVLLRRIALIDEQQARLVEIRAALCRLVGDDFAGTSPTNGSACRRSENVTDILTTEALPVDVEESGPCGCCIPPPLMDVDEEVRELQARREAVERRLAGFRAEPRP